MVAKVHYGICGCVERATFIADIEFRVLADPSVASEDRIVISARGHAACAVTTRAIGTVISETRTVEKSPRVTASRA